MNITYDELTEIIKNVEKEMKDNIVIKNEKDPIKQIVKSMYTSYIDTICSTIESKCLLKMCNNLNIRRK